MLHQPVVPESGDSELVSRLSATTEYRTDLPFSEREFSRRNLGGHVLYELFVEDVPVCYGWVAQKGSQVGILHDIEMRVPDHALYIWDCATPPAHRGRGYFQTLLRGLVTDPSSAATLALVAVDSNNEASRKALDKAGFRPLFTYLSVRILGRGLMSLALKDGKLTRAQPVFDQIV